MREPFDRNTLRKHAFLSQVEKTIGYTESFELRPYLAELDNPTELEMREALKKCLMTEFYWTEADVDSYFADIAGVF